MSNRLFGVLNGLVHRHRDEDFGGSASESYDRLARRTLGSLYRRVCSDVVGMAPPGGVIADVGAGTGRLSSLVAQGREDLDVHVVDPSADMVTVAERVARDADVADRVHLHVADVAGLPLPADSVDVIVSTLSMHHWPDVPAAAAQLRRVLRPGGRLLVVDFRFAPFRDLDDALRTAENPEWTEITMAKVRLPWYPFAPYARLLARSAGPAAS
ncbi:class I SAM-dependent methyltransferase [Phytoactinopolyspora halotolerans]|uniref:Class I SAM-dependent methyltransferase n=1 Tax=Phytoactinopolyspora halotolerans TaxID=1981512 RepID=A0A6L9SET2_9ACTN|nr:class I SAM-dependent methyltransferase [Phytoactinopolyspora halotolerans]NEE02982.1 class I SAM-dependent methyltransferase [Phytoactinopolyspora halotolerans]